MPGALRTRFAAWHLPVLAVCVALASCTHSAAYTFTEPPLGPPSTGDVVQLTYNLDQDYWPTWTQDGKGILYAFVAPGPTVNHRCLGILPPHGGTRIWELCDNRAGQEDSVSSYSAFALDSTGQLLVAEATTSRAFSSFPAHISLFLTDTAHPYKRTTLLTLPIRFPTTDVTWLSDITWTGPNTFLALGQQFGTHTHCFACMCLPCPEDTIFTGNGIIVSGIIAGGRATLTALAGTEGASGYAVMDGDPSVFFVREVDGHLLRTSRQGGSIVTVATITADSSRSIAGVACRGGHCVVATAEIDLRFQFPMPKIGDPMLVEVNVATGAIANHTVTNGLVFTPQASSSTGDVVVQTGGLFGHFTTNSDAGSNLVLYKAMLP